MPEMHWIYYADADQRTGEKAVDDDLLCQGKLVFLRHRWLRGEKSTGKVTVLTRWEDPTSFLARVGKNLHLKKLGGPSPYGVSPRTRGCVESDTGWSVGALNPARFAGYHFEDDFAHRSPVVWVSDSPSGTVDRNKHASIGAMIKGIGIHAGAGTKKFRIWTCNKDPDLLLELMLPWQPGPHNLRAFAVEYLAYLAPNLEAEEALDAASDGYLPPEAPADWHFSLEPTSISLGEGEEATVDVTVSAPTPGRAAFAVRVFEKGEPDNFVISPIVEVEQTVQGAQAEVRRLEAAADAEKARIQHEISAKKIERLKEEARKHPHPKPQ
jgi:hypothetical protein